jgi:hypothetical protein
MTTRDVSHGHVSEISWKSDTRPCCQISKEGKLADAAMLEFYVAKAVEAFLVSILQKAKRVL